MLKIDENGVIHLTRGDTARISVQITNDQNGNEYEVSSDDALTLTVRVNARSSDILLQKVVTGTSDFYIAPEDTQNLSFREYVYDIQLTTAAGDVYTIITPRTFEITEEVTY